VSNKSQNHSFGAQGIVGSRCSNLLLLGKEGRKPCEIKCSCKVKQLEAKLKAGAKNLLPWGQF
jgi:hypothetical protein